MVAEGNVSLASMNALFARGCERNCFGVLTWLQGASIVVEGVY